jgi:type IV pilus assembly protein PilA
MQAEQGFTMVELMIITAIIGILVAIAIPAYQDNVVRSKVTEAVLAASACRTAVSERYQSWPPGAGPGANSWGCENAAQVSTYVSSVATDANGAVTVTTSATGLGGNPSADGTTIILTPLTSAGAVITAAAIPAQVGGWACNKAPGALGTMPLKYLSSSCK